MIKAIIVSIVVWQLCWISLATAENAQTDRPVFPTNALVEIQPMRGGIPLFDVMLAPIPRKRTFTPSASPFWLHAHAYATTVRKALYVSSDIMFATNCSFTPFTGKLSNTKTADYYEQTFRDAGIELIPIDDTAIIAVGHQDVAVVEAFAADKTVSVGLVESDVTNVFSQAARGIYPLEGSKVYKLGALAPSERRFIEPNLWRWISVIVLGGIAIWIWLHARRKRIVSNQSDTGS